MASARLKAYLENFHYEDANFTFGKWRDFKLKINWSDSAEGSINAWIDDKKIISYAGPVGNPKFENPYDNLGNYVKMGLYCAKGPEIPLVLFHDNYSRIRLE